MSSKSFNRVSKSCCTWPQRTSFMEKKSPPCPRLLYFSIAAETRAFQTAPNSCTHPGSISFYSRPLSQEISRFFYAIGNDTAQNVSAGYGRRYWARTTVLCRQRGLGLGSQEGRGLTAAPGNKLPP